MPESRRLVAAPRRPPGFTRRREAKHEPARVPQLLAVFMPMPSTPCCRGLIVGMAAVDGSRDSALGVEKMEAVAFHRQSYGRA